MEDLYPFDWALGPIQYLDFTYMGGVHSDLELVLFLLQAELPEDKPRILPGVLTPHNVLEAVKLGFDIVDTSYPLTGNTGEAETWCLLDGCEKNDFTLE